MSISTLNKILWLIILSVFSLSAIADIKSATGKPFLDFYTVYGAIDSIKLINELCNVKYLEYKKQNNHAYSLWRSRNREFIYKIEQYNHAILTKESAGDMASYSHKMRETALEFEKNRILLDKMFSDFGENSYRQICLTYPKYTTSEKADFPNYYAEHIQVFEKYWTSRR